MRKVLRLERRISVRHEYYLVKIEQHRSSCTRTFEEHLNHSGSHTPVHSLNHPAYHYSQKSLRRHSHHFQHHFLFAAWTESPVSPSSDSHSSPPSRSLAQLA